MASAARFLAAGDPLAALRIVALRDDPSALALRGIAMAQLGEYGRARALLRRAARDFGPRERLARARCQAADGEIALAARDLGSAHPSLEAVARTLEQCGDDANARHTRVVAVRRLLMLGKIADAEAALATVDGGDGWGGRPALLASRELARAEIAARRVDVDAARGALARASEAAARAGIPALVREIERTARSLEAPAARLVTRGGTKLVALADIEALGASDVLVVDGCRRTARVGRDGVDLAKRPILFSLARQLAEAWPEDVVREELVTRTFEVRPVHARNDSHRARLRVEMGRLRAALRPLASIVATAAGYRLVSLRGRSVVLLVPPVEGDAGTILALLGDGQAWSTSSLGAALGQSQRSVQRVLRDLEARGAVRSVARGRSRRWLAPPITGFATTLLLPGALPVG